MNGEIVLCIGIHNHQPVGNFESVFREAFSKSYTPFLKILKKYPSVRISLHISGALFDWAEKNEKKYFLLLTELVERGQIEFLTGGYYEPILSVIPESDAENQILMHKNYLKKKFNAKSTGLWLTERIWDKSIPSLLNRLKISHTIVDDTHLYYAGKSEEEISGFFVTEHLGKSANIFPIDKNLRYLIPFAQPEESIRYLRERAAHPSFKILTYADDGEKFGLWPGTYGWVYESGYLERFFTLIQESSSWLKIKTFNEILNEEKPKGIVHIPPASYDEMMEWSLPPEKIIEFIQVKEKIKSYGFMNVAKPFIRGGLWENFFAKYPESNIMHKRMLLISRMKDEIKRTDRNKKLYDEALVHLFKAQVNCPYWHGLFGGLYLNYLRNIIYTNILKAQKNIEMIKPSPACTFIDIDTDGENEIFLNGREHSALIKPSLSASLMEWSYKPTNFNFLSTFSRKFESFHKRVHNSKKSEDGSGNSIKSIHNITASKEDGLSDLLIYDKHLRFGFIDSLPEKSPEFKEIYRSEIEDLPAGYYSLTKNIITGSSVKLKFKGEGLSKNITFHLDKAEIFFNYELENSSEFLLVEFNFSLLASNDLSRYYTINGAKPEYPHMSSSGETEDVRTLSMIDRWQNIAFNISVDKPVKLYRYPVETVSQSEEGFEKTYQGSCLTFVKDFSKLKNKTISFTLNVSGLQ